MKQIVVICLIIFGILSVINMGERKEPNSQMIMRGSDRISNVYLNGEDITKWYVEANDKAIKAVETMFIDAHEIEIIDMCHLQGYGITIAAVIDRQNYSFFCSFDGDIISHSQPETLINIYLDCDS